MPFVAVPSITSTITPSPYRRTAVSTAAASTSSFREGRTLQYFAAMTIEEAANVLQISRATAKRWWVYARAWLYAEVERDK